MPFKLELVTDTAGAVRGVKDFGAALDGVADSLDDVARTSDTRTRDVTGDLEKVGKEAEDSADKLERKFRDAFREVEREAETKTRNVADETRRNVADKGGDAVGEFKDEAKQNFSEVASSFSGGIDSAADLVQGTLGGLAGSLAGPAGLAAGVLAGIGGAMFAAFQANAEKTEQRIEDMYADMMESGLDYLSDQFIANAVNEIVTGGEDAVITLKRAQEEAEYLGVNVATVAAAYAGSKDAVDEVRLAIAAKRKEAEDSAAAEGRIHSELDEQYAQIEADLGAIGAAHDTVAGKVEIGREAVRRYASQQEEVTKGVGHTIQEYEALRGQIDKLPAHKSTTVTVIPDLAEAERTIRNWRPVITGTVRAGQAVV